MSNQHTLEPRVARLEVGLEKVSEDVRALTAIVREQNLTTEKQYSDLRDAITKAAAPKKTDWSTIIAGVMLIMAIGSAVFWPLNNSVNDIKDSLTQQHQTMVEHIRLDAHPVGAALIQRLDQQMKSHVTEDEKMIQEMRVHFHEELVAEMKTQEQAVRSLEAKVDLHNDRLYARVVKVEDTMAQQANSDLNELRLWRLRAMNGEIKSNSQISTDIIFDPHVPKITEPTTPASKPK